MTMYKSVDTDSWAGIDVACAEIVKVAARGLTGNDRREFFDKRAASSIFADVLDRIKLGRGDIPIHLIAIGASEYYGDNRNGDAFSEKTCRNRHDSFVKDAVYFRDHASGDRAINYGRVKLSAYNEDMHRIELLIIGNGTKEAAERNGGKVMSQRTLDKLASGGAVPWSMGCKIAYDVCANCGNKAPTRAQYCDKTSCVSPTGRRMPGCKTGLTKLGADGFRQHVDNPEPITWYDISEITTVQADPTATGGLADYLMHKAAAAGYVPGGAELHEHRGGFSLELFEDIEANTSPLSQLRLLEKLARLETFFFEKEMSSRLDFAKAAKALPDPDVSGLTVTSAQSLVDLTAAFADCGVMLSPAAFLKLAGAPHGVEICPTPCNTLFFAVDMYPELQNNPFMQGSARRCSKMARIRQVSQDCSLTTANLRKAAVEAVLLAPEHYRTKTSAGSTQDSGWSKLYAKYKLAYLLRQDPMTTAFENLCWQAVAQTVTLPA